VNDDISVLITGAGALLGQGIMRSLQNSPLKTKIIAVDPSPLSVGLYWADEAHLVPMATEPNYMHVMRQIIAATQPSVLCVGTDVELHLFAQHRAALEREFGLHVLVSRPEVIEIADDKWLTAQYLKKAGFAYPLSALPGDENSLIAEHGFPLIVKPRVGARSVGFRVCHNSDQLSQALRTTQNPVIQEHIGTDESEFTAGALCFGDACLTIVMRRHLRDGNTYRAFVENSAELNAFVKNVALSLRPYGPINFQFRLDNDVPKIFEINARFSGTTPLRALAGFNEVEMALRYLMLGEALYQPNVKDVTILRYWSETVLPSEKIIKKPTQVF
jgi:carbamoyl-phosphate synthase large subunit